MQDNETTTSFINACFNGNLHKIRLCIENGEDVNYKSNHVNMFPIHYACVSGKTDAVKLLIELGADVNVKNLHGYTPLACVITSDNYNLKEVLRKNGAKI